MPTVVSFSRWSSGSEGIGYEMGRRIVDLHHVLTRFFRVDVAALWLVGSEPLLGLAPLRPGNPDVLEAVRSIVRRIIR